MTTLSRFQFNAIVRAAIAGISAYYPALAIGQNMPVDFSGATLRVFNDRVNAALQWYTADMSTFLPSASCDATTGLPTAAFGFKLAEGALGNDPSVTGTWFVQYSASAKRTINSSYGGTTLVSHTYSAGVGIYQFTYTAGGVALGLVFADGGVTDIHAYDPTISSVAISGGTPPRWNAQFLRTTQPYDYFRFMDVLNVNGDFASTSGFQKTVINWSDRTTPAGPARNKNGNPSFGGGLPLEWLIDLCAQTGRNGWFNVPEFASDDYITQMATLAATTMQSGLWSGFELGNERWNTAPGFYCYRKAGYAAMTEALACQAYASEWGASFTQKVLTFASDGTNATVTFQNPHGATTGGIVVVSGLLGGYTGLAPTGTLTVIDASTVRYPCTQASTGGTVGGTVVLPASGFIALNGASTMFSGNNVLNIYSFSELWHYRRAYQMAGLVKAAFTAAGRTLNDCKPILAIQAGNAYFYGNKHIEDFLNAFTGTTVRLGSVFTAASVGGYLTLAQSSVVNPGFSATLSQGKTKNGLDPTLTTEAAVSAQLQEFADVSYATYCYQAFVAWCRYHGMESWGYEIGLDLAPISGETTAQRAAKEAYQTDYSGYGSQQEAMFLEWIRNFQTVGFTKIGWYQCGAGTFAGYGTFNLGQTANEIDYTTATASQSPRFRAIIDSKTPPVARVTRHAFPCTLSGYDCVGNEAVVTVGGAWPSLSGSNLNAYFNYCYPGPANNGQTYDVWSETAQTVTLTMLGDNKSGANQTVNVLLLGGSPTSFVAPANAVAAVLGTCQIALNPGKNYILINATAATFIFPHSIQFS